MSMADKELLSFVRSFRRGILGKMGPYRMCYAVCGPLQSLLHLYGVETELFAADVPTKYSITEHIFLKLADGRIIDPTISQFQQPGHAKLSKVYLGPMPEWFADAAPFKSRGPQL